VPNRLRAETSPYLQQHAENPVDWWPWTDEALRFAREQDRPIFLSIGYAACHWCHVMAHESFEDPAVAELLNRDFVPIKVDREERPDLDAIYMQAAVTMTGQGGWPLSVFLTPAGEPFFAGTYFPPERRHRLPAFREVLAAITAAWQADRSRLQATAQQVLEQLAQPAVPVLGQAEIEPSLLTAAAHKLFASYDWAHGGWGGAPKFPPSPAVDLLLALHLRLDERLPLEMAVDCLKRMARGGIHDQLGGGFHRYAVDAAWQVPHFEKMLYDNALLARVYLHAWQVTGDDELLDVCRDTLDYLLRDLAHPAGGFFSSEDADSEGVEGRFYVWSASEARDTLQPSGLADLGLRAFGITEAGNFEGHNVLHQPAPPSELAERLGIGVQEFAERRNLARRLLLDARGGRLRPGRDEKVLTDWNALLLISLAEAARALGEPGYLAAAQKLADFLLSASVEATCVQHTWRDGHASVPAFLKDYAALGEGLLALYQTDFDNRWYLAARVCAQAILAGFEDPGGGFFDVSAGAPELLIRPMELQDSPTPSGGALAAQLLLHLSALGDEPLFAQAAERAILRIQPQLRAYPAAFASWLTALDAASGPHWQLALLGRTDSSGFQELARVPGERWLPHLVTAGGPPDMPQAPALLRDRSPIGGQPTAYLCRDFRCDLPTGDPEVLRDQLTLAAGPGVPSRDR
jgi:hypothetical protein